MLENPCQLACHLTWIFINPGPCGFNITCPRCRWWRSAARRPSVLLKQPSIRHRYVHGLCYMIPGSQVHGANMGPIWCRQDPGGTHVGPMNFAIWDVICCDIQCDAVITRLIFFTIFIIDTPQLSGVFCVTLKSDLTSILVKTLLYLIPYYVLGLCYSGLLGSY